MDRDPFADNFLKAITTLRTLNNDLCQIGLSGCRELKDLERVVLEHGAETYRIDLEPKS